MLPSPCARYGKYGEDLVTNYFLRQGYAVLGRNLRCRYGEIDLLVQDRDLVVCVEVKTRKKIPCEVWPKAQQERLRKAAMVFFDRYDLLGYSCRFDLITVWKVGEKWILRHQKNVLVFDDF
ncbi:MAG: YraN family protein [Patescibacteria group bacterium]